MLPWSTYAARHDRRRQIALEAAAQGPAAVVEVIAEAFGLNASAQEAVLRWLHRRPPQPPPNVIAGLLEPAPLAAPPPFDSATDLAFRDWCCRRSAATSLPADPTTRLAWLCAALLGHAQDHQELHRDAWVAAIYPANPRDELTQKVLRRVQRGDAWSALDPIGRLTWGAVKSVFQTGLRGLHLPAEVQIPALARLEESWPYLLVGGTQVSGPDLPEVLLRAVETLGGAEGPVTPVARLLSEDAWARLAADLVYGRWRGPLGQLYRTPRGSLARVAAITRAWRDEAGRFEQDMLAVMVLRLITSWARRPETCLPSAAWRRFEAGFSRGRARLRAAANASADRACAALLAAPAPYARLLAGVKRYAVALFWREAEKNFPGDGSASPAPPGPAPEGLDALLPTPEVMGALRGWVLLAELRGDGPLVAGWRDRTIGRVGGSWDRRQKERSPPLFNPDGVEDAHRLARLSLALASAPELLGSDGAPGEALLPFLARVAKLDGENRKTLDRIREILREASLPGPAPEPGGGAPSMVREARRWQPRRGDKKSGGEA